MLDQATGRLTQVSVTGRPHLVDIDDRTLYFMGSNGATAVDVDTQQATPVESLGSGQLSLVDAEDGTMLGYDRKGNPVVRGQAMQDTLEFGVPDVVSLSPDGSRVVGGSAVTPGPAWLFEFDGPYRAHRDELPTASYLAYPYAWVDADTVALVTVPEQSSHYQLVACTFSKLECDVVVPDLGEGLEGGVTNGTSFVLPTGIRYNQ